MGFTNSWSAISHQYKHFLPHISSWTHPPALPEIKEFLQHEQHFHSALYFTSNIFPNKQHDIFLKTRYIQHPRANNSQDKMKIVLTLCLQVAKSLKRKGSGKDSIKSFSSCSTQYVFFFVCFSSSLKSWSESRIAYWQETTLNTTLTVICTKIKHLFTWILKLRTRKIRNLGPLYPN